MREQDADGTHEPRRELLGRTGDQGAPSTARFSFPRGLAALVRRPALRFGVVEPGRIYRSGQMSPRRFEFVCLRHGIRTVIDLNNAEGGRGMGPGQERDIARRLGVEYHVFRLSGDGTGKPEHYARIIALLGDATRHPVLVHCHAGAQRTTVALLLYQSIVKGRRITREYPGSFRFGHKPRNYRALAFIADHREEIARLYREQNLDRGIPPGRETEEPGHAKGRGMGVAASSDGGVRRALAG